MEYKYKKSFSNIINEFKNEFTKSCGQYWTLALYCNGITLENNHKEERIDIIFPSLYYDFQIKKFSLEDSSPKSFYKRELEIILKYLKKIDKNLQPIK